MADDRRIKRLESRLRQDIAQLFLSELKDPRIKGLISITRVELSKDLVYAKVYWSLLGSDADQRGMERFLKDASTRITKLVGDDLEIRTRPRLTFIRDDSIEKQTEMSKLIDAAIASDKKPTKEE